MSQPQTNKRHHSARAGARRGRDVTSPLGPIGGARTLVRMIGRAARVQAYEVGLMAALVAMAPLRKGSPLLRRLAAAPLPDGVKWLAFTATADIIVPGFRSVPPHPEVETITVGGVGHNGMLLNRQVVGRIVAALPAPE